MDYKRYPKLNRLFKKYIQCNNHNKNALHNECKVYRHNLSTLMRQSKKPYYFKNDIKDLKSTWNRIKSIISLKAKESESSKTFLNNKGEVLTNSLDIASSFDIFFVQLHQTSSLILNKSLISLSK